MWSVVSSLLSYSPPLGGWDGKPQPSTKGWRTCSPGNNARRTPLLLSAGYDASYPLPLSDHPSCASVGPDHPSTDHYGSLILPSQHPRAASLRMSRTVPLLFHLLTHSPLFLFSLFVSVLHCIIFQYPKKKMNVCAFVHVYMYIGLCVRA